MTLYQQLKKENDMKNYILIDGKYSATFRAKNIEDAKKKAINASDYPEEVIVREINCLTDFAKLV